MGGARLNAALSQIRASWDFSGERLTLMGKRTVVGLLDGAVGLTRLDLSHMDLEGSVPPALAECARLEALDLSFNKLFGPLPLGLGLLKARGCKVDLRGNKGFTLPTDASGVANAAELDLSGCSLGGVLPLEVILLKARGCRVKLGGNLPGLTLPHNVGDLADLESDLRILNLACCSLRGKVRARRRRRRARRARAARGRARDRRGRG